MSEVYKKICGMELKANKTILQRRLMNTKTKNWKLLFKGDWRKQWKIVNGNQQPVEKYWVVTYTCRSIFYVLTLEPQGKITGERECRIVIWWNNGWIYFQIWKRKQNYKPGGLRSLVKLDQDKHKKTTAGWQLLKRKNNQVWRTITKNNNDKNDG